MSWTQKQPQSCRLKNETKLSIWTGNYSGQVSYLSGVSFLLVFIRSDMDVDRYNSLLHSQNYIIVRFDPTLMVDYRKMAPGVRYRTRSILNSRQDSGKIVHLHSWTSSL